VVGAMEATLRRTILPSVENSKQQFRFILTKMIFLFIIRDMDTKILSVELQKKYTPSSATQIQRKSNAQRRHKSAMQKILQEQLNVTVDRVTQAF